MKLVRFFPSLARRLRLAAATGGLVLVFVVAPHVLAALLDPGIINADIAWADDDDDDDDGGGGGGGAGGGGGDGGGYSGRTFGSPAAQRRRARTRRRIQRRARTRQRARPRRQQRARRSRATRVTRRAQRPPPSALPVRAPEFVTAEILLINPSEAQLEAARARGLTLLSRERLDGLDVEIARLRNDGSAPTPTVLERLRRDDPESRLDLNHIYRSYQPQSESCGRGRCW
ncbi:MAG: hypothetical protein AAFY46_15700, partial [Planctomycetota bacterium]